MVSSHQRIPVLYFAMDSPDVSNEYSDNSSLASSETKLAFSART